MDVLVTKPEHSLVFQSRDASFHPGCADKRNIRVNGDGFGIAWYTPRRIEEGGCVVKFPTPAWSNTNLLNIAKFVESGLVFAHVRAASDGAVLVGNVNHENTHPFKYKRYTFMHNGGIPGFARMKRQLLAQLGDEAYLTIEGSTDSELCFAYFLDELPNTGDQLSAQEISQVLRRTIARIVSAVASLSASPCPPAPPTATTTAPSTSGHDGGPTTSLPDAASVRGGSSASAAAPAMSLNFCVTDGRHIVCSRYRSHARQNPPSLFVLAGAGFACDEAGCLRQTATEPRTSVVISSEPLCRSTKSWELVPRNSMVIVEGATPTAIPATADTAPIAANSNTETADIAVAAEDGTDHGTIATSSTDVSSSAGAAAAAAAAPVSTTGAREKPLRMGLVSSIKYEPLRCHPSDSPASHDPIFPDPVLLPTFCARVPSSGSRRAGAGTGGTTSSSSGSGTSSSSGGSARGEGSNHLVAKGTTERFGFAEAGVVSDRGGGLGDGDGGGGGGGTCGGGSIGSSSGQNEGRTAASGASTVAAYSSAAPAAAQRGLATTVQ
ncbi:unnamed protein product [Ectocarpus sp. CCAP 1310/34]|nr:unnamed protein product [Ectocarpus sp. CCAP 1310/34]